MMLPYEYVYCSSSSTSVVSCVKYARTVKIDDSLLLKYVSVKQVRFGICVEHGDASRGICLDFVVNKRALYYGRGV